MIVKITHPSNPGLVIVSNWPEPSGDTNTKLYCDYIENFIKNTFQYAKENGITDRIRYMRDNLMERHNVSSTIEFDYKAHT